jgi:hypothetical protein
MIGPREILIFTLAFSGAFLAVVLIGYYYFCKWHNQEKTDGRQHIDAHLAEVMRDSEKRS